MTVPEPPPPAAKPLPGPPLIFVIAGPNGAGKTTSAMYLFPEELRLSHFVNADLIAKGLSPLQPESAAMDAGRLMLDRIHRFAEQGVSFAFETTLASRSFVPFLRTQMARGFRVHIAYVWLPSPAMSIARVQERVRKGGHSVDAETIRRRYQRGLRNFVELYAPLADVWTLCDNSTATLKIVAQGGKGVPARVFEPETYALIQRTQVPWSLKKRRF